MFCYWFELVLVAFCRGVCGVEGGLVGGLFSALLLCVGFGRVVCTPFVFVFTISVCMG